jgi:hypothetical protein
MVIIRSVDGAATGMTEEEVDRFLESKLNLQIATIDEMGDPNIQPVWFEYDKVIKKVIRYDSQNIKQGPEYSKEADRIFFYRQRELSIQRTQRQRFGNHI